MKKRIIRDDEGVGHTTVYETGDFEYVNPIEFYSNHQIQTVMSMERDLLLMHNLGIPISSINAFTNKRAIVWWDEWYKEILATEIPPNFIELLGNNSKKEQIKLLKGQSFSPNQLIALIFKAWTDFGFTLSQYTGMHHHKGLDESELPELVEVMSKKIRKVGETTLTEGQLKHAVEFRNRTVSKFLDSGDTWHCFFLTFKALKGKESWKGGQAHYHYISDKFQISRSKAVEQLKSEKYPSTPVHIDLIDYGHQSEQG